MTKTGNPFLDRLSKGGASGVHGKRSEKRVSKSLSAQLTANSGAGSQKADMRLGKATKKHRFVVEAKSTNTQTLGLEYSHVVKVTHEALNEGKAPAITLSFVDPEGKGKKFGDWVAIPAHVFQELVEDAEK